MNFTFGSSVYRLRRQLIPARYGNAQTLAGWEDVENPPERVELPMCAVAPTSASADFTLERTQSVQSMSLYSPTDVDVHVGDVIEADGVWWQVAAEPLKFVSPFTGWEAGAETRLRLFEG